jgi:hypothetical protein
MNLESACELLGVTLDANEVGLSAARRAAAMRVHPDRHIGSSSDVIEASEAEMKQINEAYDLLRRRAQSLSGHYRMSETEPAGPTTTCSVCEHIQAVPTEAVYACTKCRSPLFRMTCTECQQSADVWGIDPWTCDSGHQHKNSEVLVRAG